MTSKNLNDLLIEKISPESFLKSIKKEVENYQQLIGKTGATIHLDFTENQEIKIDKLKLSRLLHLVLEDQLTNVHLAYVCDCLTLSEYIDMTDKARAIVFKLADPEINRDFTSKDGILELLSDLA